MLIKRNLKFYKGRLLENLKSVLWVITNYHSFKKILTKEYNLTQIKIFRFFDWHLGCNYFIAFHRDNMQKVFIKTGGKYDLISREVSILNQITNHTAGRTNWKVPNLIASNEKGKYSFVAIEFIEAVSFSKYTENNNITIEKQKKIIQQFNSIIDSLHVLKLVHRDIRPDNILVRENNNELQIVLIDFAFTVSPYNNNYKELGSIKDYKELLLGLGDGLNPEPFIWDDAYSFYKIFLFFKDDHENYPTDTEELKSKIGKLTFSSNYLGDK